MRVLTLIVALLPSATAAQQTIRTDYHYRIGNDLAGTGKSLSVVNGTVFDNAAVLHPTDNVSSQYWFFELGTGGTVTLGSMFRGTTYCLDLIPTGARYGEADLRSCDGSATQRWTLVPEGPRFQIVTEARGSRECLEMIPEGRDAGRLRANVCGFYANQLWSLAVTDQPVK
jgi:hypothetical protein